MAVLQLRDHATSFVVVGDGTVPAPVVEINPDLTIPSNGTGYLTAFAFDLTRFSGCRLDYRLKNQTGGVRIGAMYIGVDTTGETSITDHYTETDSFNVRWTTDVLREEMRLYYQNGPGEKYINLTVKYFPI